MIRNIISKHKTLFSIFIISMAIGGFAFSYFNFNIIAIVDGMIIWKKDFNETFDLMVKYYDGDHNDPTTHISQSEFLNDPALLKRVQKEALIKMVEYKILMAELSDRNIDWEIKAEAKINEALSQIKDKQKFESGVKALYNVNADDFKAKVLMPQAQFEILASELKKENKQYEQWLKDKKETLKVRIFIDELEWKDGEIVISD